MSGSSSAHKIAAQTRRTWHLVDAKGQVVGRLATQIAGLLQGKHKPIYVPNQDVGDWVVVINAKDVALSGEKATKKLYRWHTGHPGGLRTLTSRHMFERKPERILQKAVLGMLPKTLLRAKWSKKLRIFPGEDHTHEANVTGSAAYAPAYLDQYQPKRTGLKPKAETGDFVVDYFGEGADVDESLLVEEDLEAEWKAMMAEMEAEEAAASEETH